MCFRKRIPVKQWFNAQEMIALLHNAMEVILYYDRLYITTVNWSKCNDLMTIGSLNGDLDILVSIFKDDRWPPYTRSIFLGDYLAPHGEYRYDALLFLLTLKIRFPNYIVLLRGHGETHEMCTITEFDLFCADRELFKAFVMLFNFLPLVAQAGPFLCVHSGVSPYMTSSTCLKTLPKPLGQKKISTTQKAMVTDILYGTPDDTLIRDFAPSNDYPTGFRFNKQGLLKVLAAFDAKRLIRTCRMKNKVGWCYDFDNDPICLSFITASESANKEETDIRHYFEKPLRNRYVIFLLPDGYICDCKVFTDDMAPKQIQMVYQLILPYTFRTSYICRPLGRESCLFCLGQLQYSPTTVIISHRELADLVLKCNFNIELHWKTDPRQLQYHLVELSPALLSDKPSELQPLDYAVPNFKITHGPLCSTPIRRRPESKLWDEFDALNQSSIMIDVDEKEESKRSLASSSRTSHPKFKFEVKNLFRSPVRSRSRSFSSVRYSDSFLGYEADSWGTEFIFILPPNSQNITEASCYFFGMNKWRNITINIGYNIMSSKIGDSTLERKSDKIIIKASHKYDFDKLIINDMIEGLHMLPDNRIHVTSSDKISIIAYTTDINSAVDYFLVHPIGMGGDYYAFSLPGPSIITLYFLPLQTTNETISQNGDIHDLSMTFRENDKLETINQRMQAGSLWQYTASVEHAMSVWIHDQLNNSIPTKNAKSEKQTILKIEKARLIIIASARDILLSGHSTDFGCHMPTPTIVNRCAKLTTPIYYPANQGFATNLLFTAPSHLCPQETIDFKTNIEITNQVSMKWNQAAKQISVKDKVSKQTFAIVSQTTIMNIIHHGGKKGSFIHEIPAYSQWVNGDSAIIVPPNTNATIYVLADDFGREAIMEGLEYPYFEQMDDVSADLSLFLYTRQLVPGVYRVGLEQELGGRYICIIIAEIGQNSIGYVAAINLHKIPSPIFADHSTTVLTTTTELTTTPLIVSTMTTVTTTQSASHNLLLHYLFAVCICFMMSWYMVW